MSEINIYNQVGDRIGCIRRERGMTQQALAEAIHLTRTSITNIENGKQKLLLHTFFEIAQALRVHPAELFPMIKEPQPPKEPQGFQRAKEAMETGQREWVEGIIGGARS